jgi:pyruvate formate lyase activating enzyme
MTGAPEIEAPVGLAANQTIPGAGNVPWTTVEFPGRLAMVVFTQGCPWRCGYCHDAALRAFGQRTLWRWQQV